MPEPSLPSCARRPERRSGLEKTGRTPTLTHSVNEGQGLPHWPYGLVCFNSFPNSVSTRSQTPFGNAPFQLVPKLRLGTHRRETPFRLLVSTPQSFQHQ